MSKRDKGLELKRKLKALQALYGYTSAEMGVKLRMSERSYTRRLSDIGNMKLKDLFRLEQVFHTEIINSEGEMK